MCKSNFGRHFSMRQTYQKKEKPTKEDEVVGTKTINKLRPTTLDGMVGQAELKARLKILLDYAKQTDTALPHILFSGGAGLGKTTFAKVLANELGVSIVTVNGTVWRNIKDILPYLVKVKHKSIVFCDEIHRLPNKIEEFLYPVMEDFTFNLVSKGKQYTNHMEKFTFIGATTSYGSLTKPLIDRFIHKEDMRSYSVDELSELGRVNAVKINLMLNEDSIIKLATVCRQTPRILNNYLSWCQKYCVSHNIREPTRQDINIAMEMIGIDDVGLTQRDRQYIDTLQNHFTGGPTGLSTLVATTGISSDTILNAIEPYLLSRNIIQKTHKGRILV